MPELENPRHEAMAQAYALGATQLAAGEAAGVNRATANKVFDRKPEIIARAREIVQTRFDVAGISAQRVLVELARVAFANAKDLFNERGELIDIQSLDDDAASTITAIDVEVQCRGRGDDADVVTIKKLRRADKMAALAILAKHHKLVGDEGDGVNALASALADRLKNARQRAPLQDVEDAAIIEPDHLPAPEAQSAAVPQESSDEQLW